MLQSGGRENKMRQYAQPIDVTTSTELERLVDPVQATGQPITLTRDQQILAIVQPPPARQTVTRRPRVAAPSTRFPTLESLAGAAGTLPTPQPWKEVLADAREDHVVKKFPSQRG